MYGTGIRQEERGRGHKEYLKKCITEDFAEFNEKKCFQMQSSISPSKTNTTITSVSSCMETAGNLRQRQHPDTALGSGGGKGSVAYSDTARRIIEFITALSEIREARKQCSIFINARRK